MHIKTPADFFETIYRRTIKPEDHILINTVFSLPPTQKMLSECLRVCDIEAMRIHHKILMLSYLAHDYPELDFSEYAGPRLAGLIRFYRFANIKLFVHLSRIGKALDAAGIPILLLKGGAMKVLRPAFSRSMGDIDILVPNNAFSKAFTICEGLGYRDAHMGAPHSIDLLDQKGASCLDIHWKILSFGNDTAFCKALFTRARPMVVSGIRLLLPAPEDLFFMLLINLEKNLREETSLHSFFFSLIDSRFLLFENGPFNWEIVKENINKTGAFYQTRMAAEFINTLVPGLIPEMEKHFLWNTKTKKKAANSWNKTVFGRDVIEPKAAACRKITVWELKQKPLFYGLKILKFLILKNLWSFPFVIRRHLTTRGYVVYNAG
ncbi:hypothetical protein AGMMS50230_21360 [Spirochaetia bacterium]|nr:hypothetical protein AGMMS50230_21360 [Spirochaetia bacterium]